ncbi:MAG: hypothetical protein MZV64_09665 [Ignavibacteriales bacterium]|nr:hypothetical protein [Ignavibacteriales bacterium]
MGKKALPLVEAEHFALCLFPRAQRTLSLLISNNPPEFLPEYVSVFHQDFLFKKLIETGREYVMSRDPDFAAPEHGEFIDVVQRARPISDIIYVPIKIRDSLRLLGDG